MEICINRTLSLNNTTVEQLDALNKKTKINKSKLVRIFISYFYKHEEKLKEVLE